jgi:hypothetical protein
MMKLRKIRQVEHVGSTGELRNAQEIKAGKPVEKGRMGDLGLNGRIIESEFEVTL